MKTSLNCLRGVAAVLAILGAIVPSHAYPGTVQPPADCSSTSMPKYEDVATTQWHGNEIIFLRWPAIYQSCFNAHQACYRTCGASKSGCDSKLLECVKALACSNESSTKSDSVNWQWHPRNGDSNGTPLIAAATLSCASYNVLQAQRCKTPGPQASPVGKPNVSDTNRYANTTFGFLSDGKNVSLDPNVNWNGTLSAVDDREDQRYAKKSDAPDSNYTNAVPKSDAPDSNYATAVPKQADSKNSSTISNSTKSVSKMSQGQNNPQTNQTQLDGAVMNRRWSY